MPGTRGIQNSQPYDLIDRLMAENQQLWAEVTALKASKRNEAGFLIKLFGDEDAAVAQSFTFPVPLTVDGLYLTSFDAFVATEGFDAIELDLYNVTQDVDMLTTTLVIPSYESYGAPDYIIENRYRQVFWKDKLLIDNLYASDALGLAVILEFA